MAKINLLPSEINKAKKAVGVQFSLEILLRFLLFLNLIVFLAGIYLRLNTMHRMKGLSSITNEYQQAENFTEKVKSIKQERKGLAGEIGLLNSYLKRDILWSEKLSHLSRLMPEEVWLTGFSFKKKSAKDSLKRNLYLKGALRAQEKSTPIATLSGFINQLKKDEVFSADFDNPALTDSKTETQDKVEIMAFAIEIPFKKR